MKRNLILLILITVINTFLIAENPILKGFADPHMKIWNGRMYLSVGKDESPEIKGFCMPYWAIYSTTDMVNWRLECNIDPKNTYLGAGSKICWATDITTKDGKYYFYFSKGGTSSGVLRADNPNGPYVDYIRGPLLFPDAINHHKYDPTIFIDDDGQQYIIFGRDGNLNDTIIHYQIAKLKPDMMSYEPNQSIMTDQKYGFGAIKRATDHQYFHKHDSLYYLSRDAFYMTSKNIYGPFSNPRVMAKNTGHSSFCEYNGQWYHCWEFTEEDHDNRCYRQVMLTYNHYKNNGDIVDDVNFMQKGKYYRYGVGNYDAAWDTIQAEWYFKKSQGMKKRECPNGGFEIQNIKNGDYLNFPNMKNLTAKTTINFCVSSENTKGCIIEIRKDSEKGQILGTCKVSSTASWKTYQTVSCKLKNEAGTANLYFVFKGKNDELMRLDWFKFTTK